MLFHLVCHAVRPLRSRLAVDVMVVCLCKSVGKRNECDSNKLLSSRLRENLQSHVVDVVSFCELSQRGFSSVLLLRVVKVNAPWLTIWQHSLDGEVASLSVVSPPLYRLRNTT